MTSLHIYHTEIASGGRAFRTGARRHLCVLQSWGGSPRSMPKYEQSLRLAALPLQRAEGLLLVLDTPKGRGVFASQPIPAATIIDVSPVLVFTCEEVDNHTRHTILDHYTYTWPTDDGLKPSTQAVALGLGSLFNHSTLHQNVGWKRLITEQSIEYTALRDIGKGEELCISYGAPGILWFEDADAQEVAFAARREQEELQAQAKGGELGVSGLGNIDLDAVSLT